MAIHTQLAATKTDQQNPQAPLHTIQKGKDTRPFFILHGNWTGGVPFYCYTVARTFGRQQPFYALDPYVYSGPDTPTSIEELATAHLKSIRAMQPEGPYWLAGFCNGSLIVYEIARQLQAQGQAVDLLVLIAPTNIPQGRQVVVRAIHSFCTFFHIRTIDQITWFLRLRHAARHMYRKTHASNDIRIQDFSNLLAIDPRLEQMLPPVAALFNDYVGIFTWVASTYRKRFLPKTVDFIWAGAELESKRAWAEQEQDNSSPIIPGHHMDCVTEHVDVLARELERCLLRVKASEPVTGVSL